MDTMEDTILLSHMPLWGVFLGSLIITFGSIGLGFQLGRRKRKKLPGDETIHTGPFAGATLSLLALMLAFVFGAVESRFDEVKHLAVDEANAIGTAFLRSDLLPEPDRTVIRGLLSDYVSLLVQVVGTDDNLQIEQGIQQSGELHTELWSRAVEVATQAPTPISALFVQSLNDVIDLQEARLTFSVRYRLSAMLWISLYGLAIIAMALGGFDSGCHSNRRFVAVDTATAVAFSVVLALVAALDRPHQYLPSATQEAMVDVEDHIHQSMESEP